MKIDSIIKIFNKKSILHDISLSCGKGDIIGLFGSNGAGKSTLLKIIFGSLPADQKYIKVGEKIMKNVFEINGIVRYLPQQNFLPTNIKIKSLIRIFCSKEKLVFILSHPLINPFLNCTTSQLSSGQKRIIEVLMVINSNAEYVLLDEPFKNIDPIFINTIKESIVEESSRKGFVVTDHNYQHILDIATKKVLLYDGSLKEIKDHEDLRFFKYLR